MSLLAPSFSWISSVAILLVFVAIFRNDNSTALAITSTANSQKFKHRFQPFCNYVCNNTTTSTHGNSCPDPVQFDFMECNQTQTGNGCTLEGCRGWTQGVFPGLLEEQEYQRQQQMQPQKAASSIARRRLHGITTAIDDDPPIWRSNETGKQYRVMNGGVPHYANITLHLTTLEATIDNFIPPRDFEGNLVLDFEAWSPLWEQNTLPIPGFHDQVHQEYSLEKMAQAHPSWNSTKIAQETARAFSKAGVAFFVATLRKVRSLRPRARVGFYGFPQGHYGDCETHDDDDNNNNNTTDPTLRCGYDNPTTGPMYRDQNNVLAPVYQASSALYPSVYLQPQKQGNNSHESFDLWRTYNQIYVNDTIYETIRVVQAIIPVPPIIPFYWAYYHNGSTLLLPDDVSMIAQYTYLPPFSTAVIQWGSNGERNQVGPWQTTVGGPRMQSAVVRADACAKEFCSDHGWCTRVPVAPQPSSSSDDDNNATPRASPCICDEGYYGFDCRVTSQ